MTQHSRGSMNKKNDLVSDASSELIDQVIPTGIFRSHNSEVRNSQVDPSIIQKYIELETQVQLEKQMKELIKQKLSEKSIQESFTRSMNKSMMENEMRGTS